ncbi:MAG: YfiM family protein [Chitinophagaceae bacterium]|nr:YfiM family protein [Chitinophagaceae bacterium]
MSTKAQPAFLPPSDQYRPDRLRKVVIGESVLFVVTSVGLYYLWYKKFPRSRFHFINDGREWFKMDKMGHATTAYTIATMHHDLMRWSGVKPGTAIATSAITSLAFLSIVEIMDGFSSDWGFSRGDMIANISGAAFFTAQQHWWGRQKMSLRVSARFTPYAKYNPDLLGNNRASRLMKDYNGQTYWLSVNIRSFLKTNSNFPVWLNAAVGYGADGMIGAEKNPGSIDGKSVPGFKRTKQFYIAADADFSNLSTSEAVSMPLYFLQFIKTPAPAVEVNSYGKIKLRPVQF